MGTVAAQDAATAYKRANQQYVLFESERDKGTDPTAMYNYLKDSYDNFVKVVDAPDNSSILTGAKNRLRALYPYLLNGAVYYSEQKQPGKALDFAAAYIDLPQLRIFRSELLPKDSRYASVLYYAAVAAYNLQKDAQAIKYFEEYLNTGTDTQQKDCYVYLSMLHSKLKNYEEQEKILEQAVAKYPVSVDFLYNLVNVHIATNNIPKLLAAIDRILAVDPNDLNVLPIKARILERQGNSLEALDIYKRLYALKPDNFELLTGLARANFNVATEIVNNGATIANDSEYAVVRQKAAGYLMDAKDLFLKILEQHPTDKKYMQGLAGVYQYMEMKAEYDVLMKLVADGGSYVSFPSQLLAYNETLKKSAAATTEQQPSAPMPLEPAMLVIRIDSFIDANNNKLIDADESFAIRFTVENKGKGDAYNLRLRLSEQSGYDEHFDGPRELDGGNIPAGTTKQYTFRYLVKKDIPTALAKINIYAFEGNGFDADPTELVVNTQEYSMPRLRIADHQFFAANGSSITLGDNGKLTLALQNYGTKTARGVKLSFQLPNNVFNTENPEILVDSIAPDGVVTLDYNFLVNKRFTGDSIAVLVNVTEDSHSAFLNEAYKVKVGEYLTAAGSIRVNGNAPIRRSGTPADFQLSFKSELTEAVPVGTPNPHRYALIIGNEDYSMTGANAEINVPYAVNDAIVFQEYCVRTFGIPAAQIKMIPNATAGMMHEMLDWLVNMASTDAEAELFFYYSGHGNNDEATKEAYLLPVDITGKNIRLGISLDALYKQLASYPIKGAYVFLDACFSGGYKSAAPVLSQKGVRVVPKSGLPQGNTLSFSSSSGDQTSSVYNEKKQGYYTYFLLKTLSDAKGDISMKELFEQTSAAVKRATTLIGKPQEPQCMASPTWTDWSSVRLMTQ
jgi:uncharacterized repeat protein (TIGR01451 family)